MANELTVETSRKSSKVMVAIDGGEYSSYALKWALQNLDEKLKHGVLLFTAISRDYSGVFAGSYGSVPVDLLTSIQENQKKCADSILAKAKEICAKQGYLSAAAVNGKPLLKKGKKMKIGTQNSMIDAEAVSMVGNPKDAICDAVQKHDCTLLVLGSRSRGAIGRTFLGSVSNHCVHHAKCPVLVVKSEQPLRSP